jgi:FtsP/CotA-like multicopper oxidase with cupredoxin domain
VIGGGMMGNMTSAVLDGNEVDIRTMMQNGLAWAINGVAAKGHVLDPMLTMERGRTYMLAIVNDTAWPHPMHLHGHTFRVVARNGAPTERREWQDTVLIPPRESADIAFVADNPGDWLLHCHMLEHAASGMMTWLRVAG